MHEYTGSLQYRQRDISWHIKSFLARFSLKPFFGYFFKLFFVFFVAANEENSKNLQISRSSINVEGKAIIFKEFQLPLK